MMMAIETVARLLWYLAVFQLIGTAGACAISGRLTDRPRDGAAALLRRFARTAAAALLIITIGRAFLQTAAIFGGDEGVTAATIRIVVLQTQWGMGWRWQLAAALVAVIVTTLPTNRSRPALLGLAAVAVAATVPLTGHAVAEPNPVFTTSVQVAHVLGGGVWLGSLAVLFGMTILRSTDSFAPAAWVATFSPIALTAAIVLMVSGLVTTIQYIDIPAALWTTRYGVLLMVKLGLVAGVVASGWYNWRRVRPQLGTGDGRTLRRWVLSELTFAILVLGATAILVALPK